MGEQIVFFSRCRPQNADAIDLVLREQRVFIGWPAWRPGKKLRKGHLRDAVVDLASCSDEEWSRLCADRRFGEGCRRQFTQNRNFVRSVGIGSIALVPRPERGYVYVGRVEASLELFDDPPWGGQYLQFREECGLPTDGEIYHLADVAQCWKVDHFRKIPFSAIPAWIRRSFFGRSTYGRIPNLDELNLSSYEWMDRLLDSKVRVRDGWTQAIREAETRLISQISPNAFEHLCVALLQLENPTETWIHVGGSGDGGVDGIGLDKDVQLTGRLQCKWAYSGTYEPPIGKSVPKQILASLIHRQDVQPPKDYEFWSRRRIAELVIKHADRLPVAISLHIGIPG